MRGAEGRVIRLERGLALFGAELGKVKLLAGLAEQQQQQVLQAIAQPAPSCSATLHVTATDACSGSALSGVALTATGPGTTVTGTTSGVGIADLVVNAAGSWSVQGTRTSYTTNSVSATATCGATTNVALPLTVTGQVTSRAIHVTLCLQNVSGASVSLIRSGVTVATGTTNGSGLVTFSGLASGTYTAQATYTRMQAITSSAFTVTCGSTTPQVNLNGNPVSGFFCYTGDTCHDAVPTTLFLTDPLYGSVTLTWDGSGWSGCLQTVSGGTTYSIYYQLVASGGLTQKIRAGTCPWTGTFPTFTNTGTTTTTACLPRAISSTLSYSGTNLGTTIYGTGSRTFTLSE